MTSSANGPSDGALVGRRLGPYKVEARLGEGAMGEVYRAVHEALGRPVAIKALKPQFATDRSLMERFFAEARAVNFIRHENIVECTDLVSDPGGTSYIVMELLEGTTVASAVRDSGRLPPRRAARIAAQIAEAIGAAHAKGIIHRDLKPENVFLIRRAGSSDYVKVLDFGIARLRPEVAAVTATRAGAVVGTPAYMAPEQARGEAAGPAADQYALGIMLFHMLTGRMPFAADNLPQLLIAHQQEIPPRVDALVDGVPTALVDLVVRALEKEPADRFADLGAFRDAVLAAVGELPAPAPVPVAPPARTVADDLAPRPDRATTWDESVPPAPAVDSGPPESVDTSAPARPAQASTPPPPAPVSAPAATTASEPPAAARARRGRGRWIAAAAVAAVAGGAVAVLAMRPGGNDGGGPPAAAPEPAADAAPAAEPAPPPPASARALVDAQHEALTRGDVDRYAATYHADVFRFGTFASQTFIGRDEALSVLRKDVTALVASKAELAVVPVHRRIGLAPDGRSAWIADEFDWTYTVRGKTNRTRYLTSAFAVPDEGGGWRVVASHWSHRLSASKVARAAAAGVLPVPLAIPAALPAEATEMAGAATRALASGEAFAAAISARRDAFGYAVAGSDPLVGGAAIKRAYGRDLRAELRPAGEIRAGLASGATAGWVATLVDRITGTAADGAPIVETYRVLLIMLKEADGWRIVQTHFSIGGPVKDVKAPPKRPPPPAEPPAAPGAVPGE